MLDDCSNLEKKKLELSDRHNLFKYTKQFPPYNDFEFLSLWVYNTEKNNSIFKLHGNLAIKIQDFVTGKFFYSFLGTNEVKETIKTLLEMSKADNLGNQLYLIPEINLQPSLKLEKYFLIKEDPNNFDYILSVDEIADLRGSKYWDKRNLVNRFVKLYPRHCVEDLIFDKEKTKTDIRNLFSKWKVQKRKNDQETYIETIALERFIDLAPIYDVMGLGVYCDDKLIGFISYHIIHDNYAIISFQKGDTSYKGIYAYLLNLVAKHLKVIGVTYINFEQDLGIPGLKKAKNLWRPVHFLKKYIISEV